MKLASPFCAGLCLLLSACSASNDLADGAGDRTATPDTAGSGGAGGSSGSAVSAGGSTDIAGAASTAGATDSGGASDTGGQTAAGGSGDTTAGGVGATSGGGATSGSAGAGGAGAPAGPPPPIDYSIWVLQLPIGSGDSPTTISSKQLLAGYSSPYFYLGTDMGQMFMDPASGITTGGSTHCRTEMRESTRTGGEAAWDSSGTNSMTVTGMVTMLGDGASGDVTVGQVFNGSDSIPLGELQYSGSKKGFELFYEEAKGNGGSTDLKAPVALNSKYTFEMALSKGVLTVQINAKPVYSHTPSAGILAKKFYFKFGNYDQHTTKGSTSTTPFTVVEAYSAVVVHQ
jgi:hypothetical protein